MDGQSLPALDFLITMNKIATWLEFYEATMNKSMSLCKPPKDWVCKICNREYNESEDVAMQGVCGHIFHKRCIYNQIADSINSIDSIDSIDSKCFICKAEMLCTCCKLEDYTFSLPKVAIPPGIRFIKLPKK
jgi:hypothetical protein